MPMVSEIPYLIHPHIFIGQIDRIAMVSTLNYTLSHSTPIFDGSIPIFVKPAIHQSVNQSIDPQPPRTSAQTSTEAFKLVAI